MAQIKKVESKAALEKDMLFRTSSTIIDSIRPCFLGSRFRSRLNTTNFLLTDRFVRL